MSFLLTTESRYIVVIKVSKIENNSYTKSIITCPLILLLGYIIPINIYRERHTLIEYLSYWFDDCD